MLGKEKEANRPRSAPKTTQLHFVQETAESIKKSTPKHDNNALRKALLGTTNTALSPHSASKTQPQVTESPQMPAVAANIQSTEMHSVAVDLRSDPIPSAAHNLPNNQAAPDLAQWLQHINRLEMNLKCQRELAEILDISNIRLNTQLHDREMTLHKSFSEVLQLRRQVALLQEANSILLNQNTVLNQDNARLRHLNGTIAMTLNWLSAQAAAMEGVALQAPAMEAPEVNQQNTPVAAQETPPVPTSEIAQSHPEEEQLQPLAEDSEFGGIFAPGYFGRRSPSPVAPIDEMVNDYLDMDVVNELFPRCY